VVASVPYLHTFKSFLTVSSNLDKKFYKSIVLIKLELFWRYAIYLHKILVPGELHDYAISNVSA
jgi:hypothetical protein